jgi:hypothetical protein
MDLKKLQKLEDGQTIKLNAKEYTVLQKHSEEGTLQLLVGDKKGAYVLILPEKGEGECKFHEMQMHGDHYHLGKELELKTVQ